MPRYFFHLRDGDTLLEDDGEQLLGLQSLGSRHRLRGGCRHLSDGRNIVASVKVRARPSSNVTQRRTIGFSVRERTLLKWDRNSSGQAGRRPRLIATSKITDDDDGR